MSRSPLSAYCFFPSILIWPLLSSSALLALVRSAIASTSLDRVAIRLEGSMGRKKKEKEKEKTTCDTEAEFIYAALV